MPGCGDLEHHPVGRCSPGGPWGAGRAPPQALPAPGPRDCFRLADPDHLPDDRLAQPNDHHSRVLADTATAPPLPPPPDDGDFSRDDLGDLEARGRELLAQAERDYLARLGIIFALREQGRLSRERAQQHTRAAQARLVRDRAEPASRARIIHSAMDRLDATPRP